VYKEHQLKQDWSQDLPKYYFDSSPFKTHLLNALSITFPHGERFFIDSVKNFKDHVTDADQTEAITVFVKQENWHRYAHQQYNTWLTAQGLPAVELEEKTLAKIEWAKETLKHRGWLCVTVSMEHITAIFAEHLLKHPELLNSMHPHFRELWTWHAIEEIEHKSVAIDTLNAIGGGRRRKAMIFATVNFVWDISKNTVALLRADKQLYKWRTLRDAVSTLFNTQNGLITKLILPWMTFMKKDFHPTHHNSTVLLSQFSKA